MKLVLLLVGLGLVALSTAASSAFKDYSGYKVLRARVENEQQGEFLRSMEESYMFWSDVPMKGSVEVMVGQEDRLLERRLRQQGMKFSTMIEDVQAVISEQRAKSLAHRASRAAEYVKQGHSMDWEDYHPLEDIYGWLDYLEATHEHVTTEVLGQSYEGRDMRLVKICQGGCGNKPAMWIDGGIHAKEWISPATVTFMLNELTDNLAPENQDLINQLDWYILPVINTDGYAYSHAVDRLWRKNRSPNPDGLCVGTDLNRNWSFMWNEGGSTNDSCSDKHHGQFAFSEVENRNVRDFIQARHGEIRFFDTVHSYGQFVLVPWGNATEPNPLHDPQVAMAQKGLAALEAVHGTRYEIGCIACMLYVATGGSLDWALGDQSIKYAYSLELRDTGEHGMLLPPEQILPTGRETWAFHVAAAREIIAEYGGGK